LGAFRRDQAVARVHRRLLRQPPRLAGAAPRRQPVRGSGDERRGRGDRDRRRACRAAPRGRAAGAGLLFRPPAPLGGTGRGRRGGLVTAADWWDQTDSSIQDFSEALGAAPMRFDTTSPPLNMNSAGMPRTPSEAGVSGLSSTFTFTTLMRPAYSSDSSSSAGPI